MATFTSVHDGTDHTGITGVGLQSGTAFPGSPADNDLFLRTDLKCALYRYEATGTMWLCTAGHDRHLTSRVATSATGYGATQTSIVNAPTLMSAGDMWIDDFIGSLFVGSTVNDGSNYWDVVLQKLTTANAATVIATISTISNAHSTWVEESAAVGAIVDGATFKAFRIDVTKVGTPNNLFPALSLAWRHVFDV